MAQPASNPIATDLTEKRIAASDQIRKYAGIQYAISFNNALQAATAAQLDAVARAKNYFDYIKILCPKEASRERDPQ